MKKDEFKVYSNPNIRKRMLEDFDGDVYDLEIPDEVTITALFLSGPYFADMMSNQEMFYYPTDLSVEETLMAPLFSPDVFWDFIESSRKIRMKEKLLLAPLLHVPVENEEGDTEMVSLFDGLIQVEFLKFLQTVVMVSNLETGLSDEFDEVFSEMINQLEDNGYLDQVMQNIAGWLDSPDILADLLF